MKLLITISYFHPNISGLSIYAKRLTEEMVKKGHQVTVLTSKHSKALPTKEKHKGIRIKRVWTPLILSRGPIMPTYLFESLKAVARTDLINCHLPQFEALFPILWAKLLGKKVIITYHCDLSIWPGFLNKLAVNVARISHLISGSFADKIVAYTKDYANHSAFLSKFKKKTVFILPPIKAESTGSNITRNKYRKAKVNIGFAGRVAREKGIQYLIRSTPHLKKAFGNNFKILIAGPRKNIIGGGYGDKPTKEIEAYKKHVDFLGPLSQKQMTEFYKSLDVLVLPSTQTIEAFGLVQVEAMLQGCPIIATDLPGVRVPIKKTGMGIIVPPRNSRALAHAIIRIFKNKNEYVKPKKTIEKIFNYQPTMNAYEKLFTNLFEK